jgi:hypothetical protein
VHSPTVERRARESSKLRNKAWRPGALTSCRVQGRQDSKIKPSSEGHLLSVERRARELSGQQKESQLTRDTHVLCNAERGSRQRSKIKSTNEGHSLSGERRAGESSGQRTIANERGALTLCRAQSEGVVRTAKWNQQVRGTHHLSNVE